jgi:peptidoglycan/xylan/chitin deacetylase (PgdA/CDA1 family)
VISPVVSNGPRTEPWVALTFDDGPDTVYTPPILDVLETMGAPATFYALGQRVELLPDVARRMLAVGGEVGNHAYVEAHADLRQMQPQPLLRSLSLTHEAITSITGQAPITFRPPFGFYNTQVLAAAGRFGYTTVMWDVDSLDWQGLTAQEIVANVLPKARNGSIILMHSAIAAGGADLTGTVEALPLIINALRQRGLRLVTVREMLGRGAPTSP